MACGDHRLNCQLPELGKDCCPHAPRRATRPTAVLLPDTSIIHAQTQASALCVCGQHALPGSAKGCSWPEVLIRMPTLSLAGHRDAFWSELAREFPARFEGFGEMGIVEALRACVALPPPTTRNRVLTISRLPRRARYTGFEVRARDRRPAPRRVAKGFATVARSATMWSSQMGRRGSARNRAS